MKSESIFKHLKGAKPVDPKVLAKLEKGMNEAIKTTKEKEIERRKANQIARTWMIK